MLLRLLTILARSIALFTGGFTLINLTGECVVNRFDATIWWLDLAVLPYTSTRLFQVGFALAMTWFGLFGLDRKRARTTVVRFTIMVFGLAAATVATANTITFFQLVLSEQISASTHLPLSLFVAGAMLLVVLAALLPTTQQQHNGSRRLPLSGAFITFLLFPLGLTWFFGSTDYCRPADVAVVFGAKAFANGTPSVVLADRVSHACDLYRQGYIRGLIFSGGPGDGNVHETESMQRLALQLGVDADDIWLDRKGLSTEETVRNTLPLLDSLGARRVVAVSHSYHLPRIKMAYLRRGINVYTTPAEDRSGHGSKPKQLAREVIAFWAYYIRPLTGSV